MLITVTSAPALPKEPSYRRVAVQRPGQVPVVGCHCGDVGGGLTRGVELDAILRGVDDPRHDTYLRLSQASRGRAAGRPGGPGGR